VLHGIRAGNVDGLEKAGDRLEVAARQMQDRRIGKLGVTGQPGGPPLHHSIALKDPASAGSFRFNT